MEFWTPCDMLYQRKMPTMFLGDSPFFCFELNYIWEIAFSPTKGEYNEYNCISANIVHEVLKHVSDTSWGYVIHIEPRTLLVVSVVFTNLEFWKSIYKECQQRFVSCLVLSISEAVRVAGIRLVRKQANLRECLTRKL